MRCKTCDVFYSGDLSEYFYTRKSGKLKRTCKVCIRERSSKRYRDNKKECLSKMSDYYQANRASKLKKAKEYQDEVIYTMDLVGYGPLDVTRGKAKNWNTVGYLGYILGEPFNYRSAPPAWEKMWNEQGGRCLITGQFMKPTGSESDSACVDHCHETGKIRGLLTSAANKVLGFIEVNNINIDTLSEYLGG